MGQNSIDIKGCAVKNSLPFLSPFKKAGRVARLLSILKVLLWINQGTPNMRDYIIVAVVSVFLPRDYY